MDHASDAFFLYDEQGTVLDVNRQACESLGYSRDELIGMTRVRLWSRSDTSAFTPIATARNNARAGMRLLEMSPPNLAEVMEALGCVVRAADRAKEIVNRVRDHVKKAPPRIELFDLNEAIDDVDRHGAKRDRKK